ncbi:hypothetical protein AGMMS49940_03310 [Spirochaetia bacterium]|nr:hypothetical protein AGMMS49940_03310 [Spirochaetia bacterium]
MKRIFGLLGLIVCVTTMQAQTLDDAIKNATNEISKITSAQTVKLDEAIKEAGVKVSSSLTIGNKVAILNLKSDSANLSNYIIEELINSIVNNKSVSVVGRSDEDLKIVRQELKFQTSGEVDNDSAQSIGHLLGAETVVVGSFVKIDKSYRFWIRALTVETGVIQAAYSKNVANDGTVSALVKAGKPQKTPRAARAPKEPREPRKRKHAGEIYELSIAGGVFIAGASLLVGSTAFFIPTAINYDAVQHDLKLKYGIRVSGDLSSSDKSKLTTEEQLDYDKAYRLFNAGLITFFLVGGIGSLTMAIDSFFLILDGFGEWKTISASSSIINNPIMDKIQLVAFPNAVYIGAKFRF